MTWEWVLLISVLLICLTTLLGILFLSPNIDTNENINSEIEAIKQSILKVTADHESIVKTAEETKKLLSQQNLAIGLQPRQR